jgi:hypothetical protein
MKKDGAQQPPEFSFSEFLFRILPSFPFLFFPKKEKGDAAQHASPDIFFFLSSLPDIFFF